MISLTSRLILVAAAWCCAKTGAAQSDLSANGSFAADVVNSAEARAFSKSLQTQFGETAKSVDAAQINETRKTLPQPVAFPSAPPSASSISKQPIVPSRPRFVQFGNDLKYGKPIVVSESGEEIVSFIRSFVRMDPGAYAQPLAQLKALADRGTPEALNFVGFIYEYGLFQVSRNLERASDYYRAAAAGRYQPALLNLGSMTYFGRGIKNDANAAYRLISLANAIGPESSSRVCGMGALMAYRLSIASDALKFSRGCNSPLAALATAKYGQGQDLKNFAHLRNSIIAGADDGFDVIADLGARMPPRPDFMQCRFKVIGQARLNTEPGKVRAAIHHCVTTDSARISHAKTPEQADTAISELTGSVMLELQTMAAARKGARFQHAMSVPYLPFSQVDVNQWLPLIEKGSR